MLNNTLCRFLALALTVASSGIYQHASAKVKDCAILPAGQSYKDCLAQVNAKNLQNATPAKGPVVLDRAVKSKAAYDKEVSPKGRDKPHYFSLKDDKTAREAGEKRGLMGKTEGHYTRTLDQNCKGYTKSKIAGGDGRRVQVNGSNKDCPGAKDGPFMRYKQ